MNKHIIYNAELVNEGVAEKGYIVIEGQYIVEVEKGVRWFEV